MSEKMGFKDTDKGSPEHDKIQIWCHENIRQIISSVFPIRTKQNPEYKIQSLTWEYPVIQSGYNSSKFIVGFIDLFISISDADFYARIFIEIKTKIPSIGELIRQINFYKTYANPDNRKEIAFIVISPDDSFKNILSSQNIYFFKYENKDINIEKV